jgi:hypothetical protein
MNSEHFDAVIIGSGFGGSVMAYNLAEAGGRSCRNPGHHRLMMARHTAGHGAHSSPIMPGPIGYDPIPQHCDHGLEPCCCACCALMAVARERPEATTATSNQLFVDIGLFLVGYIAPSTSSRASPRVSQPCQRMTGSMASAPTASAHHQPKAACSPTPARRASER